MLIESNAAVADLLFQSSSRELGHRHELNPFLTEFEGFAFNFRKLGLHNRSTGITVVHQKINVNGLKRTAVKNYLNLIRYINLAEQIKQTMESSQQETNKFAGIDVLQYHLMPSPLQEFQRKVLQMRRNQDWDIDRDEEIEALATGLGDAQKAYFIGFSVPEDAQKSKGEKAALSKAVNKICYRVLRALVLNIEGQGTSEDEGEEEEVQETSKKQKKKE